MKKTLISLAVLLCSLGANADEGMWTLYNLPQAVYEQMQQEGFTMPYEGLYEGENALKNCVINFGGYCSGVVVSPDGLVFTNHHCGFECIRSHSTVEHDYMLNGFIANSYEEELPNKNLFVSFMIEQRDVTDELNQLGMAGLPFEQTANFVDSIENLWQKQMAAKDSTLRVELKPFYEGNKYYLTTYRDFRDVRLVFAIPKSMGKFGGETDNWMWPRQTCDFSVFRIYANPKTNGPAEYSEQNVPYHPQSWAPVSMKGYEPGSFSMTIGYPGTTNRYLSSYGIREMRDAENTPRAQVRGVKQDVMIRHMRASEAVRIKYDSKYANSSNYWKNALGMNKCIDSIGLIQQKAEFEARIRMWQDSTGYLKNRLDFALMDSLYRDRFETVHALTCLWESFGRTNEFCTRAFNLLSGRKEVKGPKGKPKKQYVVFDDNSDEWDEALDREVFATMLKNYEEQVDSRFLPDFYRTIHSQFGGNHQAYADYLWNKSVIMKTGKKIYTGRNSFAKDPGAEFGLDLVAMLYALSGKLSASSAIDEQEKMLCAAVVRMEQDLPNYSDANFTMRLSYGQVGEYLLGGKPSGYYTTARSIVDKMERASENVEYEAEPIMHQLLSATDFGPYTDPRTGTMQLCFLTNNDITGGNSGSPMFNGQGELIGLAFDGNWDSLSSDIFFDRQLARCIGVDIRYVLFMMDRWGHADRLLKEINAH